MDRDAQSKPTKLRGHSQQIYLKIPEYEFDWQREPCDIQLPDGTVVHPAIEVIDEAGNIYDAIDGSRWGNLVGFSVKPNSTTGAYLSDDQQNVKVRIRSFEPFDCAELGWHTKWMK